MNEQKNAILFWRTLWKGAGLSMGSWIQQFQCMGVRSKKKRYIWLTPNVNEFCFVIFSDSQEWKVLATLGDQPSPRVGATLSAVGNTLYMIGGVNKTEGWLNKVHSFNIGECSIWKKNYSNSFGIANKLLYLKWHYSEMVKV